ncbi:MAG TPA: GHMP kinase [Methanocorpusculum sp.]|nr:GHMP kinase [Methanocorpusculum sp.]
MERTAIAFAPGHISGYFMRIDGATPRTTGSCGAGIVIDHGVTATVMPADHTSIVTIEHLPSGNILTQYTSSLIEDILETIGVSASVKTVAALPIGAGFGMSAAAILATLTATNAVYDLGFTEYDIVEQAHTFEINHHTGLGDVAASAGGGLVIRTSPGVEQAHTFEITHHTGLGDVAASAGGGLVIRTSPGVAGVAVRMFYDIDIYTITFGPIFTPKIINSTEQMQNVSAAFPHHIPKNIYEFIENSREFAEESGLIPKVIRSILTACDDAGIPASMTMLGCGVFAAGDDAREILTQFGSAVSLKICQHGPKLLEMV